MLIAIPNIVQITKTRANVIQTGFLRRSIGFIIITFSSLLNSEKSGDNGKKNLKTIYVLFLTIFVMAYSIFIKRNSTVLNIIELM